jgi:hypothetical protein
MALAVTVGATARIATGFGRTYSYLVPSARHGFPDWMRGPLAGLAAPLSRHGFVILLAVTSVAFVVALAVAPRLPVWLAATAITLVVTICALAPPLLSTDVFNYVAYARMGVRGINPYAHGTIAFRGDPSYPYVGHFWNHTPTAYGPLFTLFSYCLAPLGVAGAMWAFKAIAAVTTLACVAFTWSCAQMLGRQPMRAALLVGLNPLVLVFGVGGGHNDALLALAVLAGIWVLLRRRAAPGAAAVTSAAGIKVSAVLALPFMAVAERPSWRVAAGIALSGAALVGAGFALFGSSLLNIGDAVRLEQHYGYQLVSVPGFAAHVLGFGPIHSHGGLVLKLLFAGVSGALGVRCIRDRNWLAATGWSVLVLLATLGWVLPWYLLWLLPFAALARSRLLLPATVALTLAITAVWAGHYATSHARHHRHAQFQRAAMASPGRRFRSPTPPGPPAG